MANASHVNDGDTEESGIQPDLVTEASPANAAEMPHDADKTLLTADPEAAPLRSKQYIWRQLFLWVILLLIIASGVMVWLWHDTILDWVHTRDYTPPQDIVTLADDTTMTPYGKRLFYVNFPVIQDKTQFNVSCPDASHEVAVLGCYSGNRNGIYLYRVADARLGGITQVTAAHEMLHQAFDRLSPGEKKRVTALLQDYYDHKLSDKNIKDKIDSYKKLEPNDLVSEMHSVFGTEVDTLPPDLETYYKQYFTDRSKVVAFRNRYVSAFSERERQVAVYDAQRDDLKHRIDQAQTDLTTWEKRLRDQRDQMNGYLAANDVERYNALVPAFNAQVAAYKAKVTSTNDLINEYNSITDTRNTLTAQEQELIKAQDSHASSADTE
jgi:prefoldin subunit 5